MSLIPDPDFSRTHVTEAVLREDRRTLARRKEAARMRERRLRQKPQLIKRPEIVGDDFIDDVLDRRK